ncbi:FAD dependent oxidoreductase [Trichoderma guizhouense]|uniref:FAD dependent oxidoreductase n=1 Tax=Trichoderma guizhouense TaxID=1491466 RepID=A0A1T3CI93_9HYPO|nr:FAD dependent oxidoreductase [Trichoderma guizhouense]
MIGHKLQRLMADPGLPAPNPTTSFWQSSSHPHVEAAQSEALPETRDVVILGSGITGCSVAQWLLKEDDEISITVLDARGICSGATGRNGGHIRCVAVQDYDRLSRKYGHDAAVKMVRFSLSHFESIASTAREFGDRVFEDSEIREVQTVSAILSQTKMNDMTAMLKQFEEAFPDMKGQWRICGPEEAIRKYGLIDAAGALIGRAGAAWPYRLILGIFSSLLEKHHDRFSVEQHTPATSITRVQSNEYPYLINTPRGYIKAKHVVHCTEGHVGHLLPRLRGLVFPRRGQMTVQAPGPEFPALDGRRSWSFYFENGFDYLSQNARTGDVFLGGGDIGEDAYVSQLGESSDENENVVAKAHLVGILPSILKKAPSSGGHNPRGLEVKSSWTGIMCTPLDGLPLVGKLPQEALDRPSGSHSAAEWISAGYNGYGMVNAWLCGRATAEMILKRDVSSWFPEQYLITTDRVEDLNARWASIAQSSQGLRALL